MLYFFQDNILLKRLAIILMLFIIAWSSKGQDLHYEYLRNDHRIGSLEIKHLVNDGLESFTIHNKVAFKIIFSFNVEYKLQETFIDGVLSFGEGFNTLNGVSQKETVIKLKDDGYHLKIDGIEAHNEKSPIRESMSRIYHEELQNGKKVYSQYFGMYLIAEKIGENKYSLKSPDGENIYQYSDGYCVEVKVIRDFATFYIKMLPESRSAISSK